MERVEFMQDHLPSKDVSVDLSVVPPEEWLQIIEDVGEERGYFEPLGPDHSAILTDEGSTLLVTFETIAEIRKSSPLHQPEGWAMIRENGWSNLCILAHNETWYRDRAVYGFFDRLVEDGFFEEFERVIFYGAGMCGYAASAFSVVAPDVTVIAVQPQATLDPDLAEFDRRYPAARKRSFVDRYGYAPDMIDLAEDVFIFFDPAITEDTVHASLFQGIHVHHIRCRRQGENLGRTLQVTGVAQTLMEQAAAGRLTEKHCYRALRVRRRYLPYLRNLLGWIAPKRKPRLIKVLAEFVLAKRDVPEFHKALEQANQDLAKSSD